MGGQQPRPIGLTNNPLIDQGTSCRAPSPLPGPMGSDRAESGFVDELTPIARYIAGEMNTNAHGPDVKHMAEMNAFSAEACIADFTKLPWWQQLLGLGIRPEDCVNLEISYHTAALLLWALKVRQDGDWDHKPRIASRFHPRVPHGSQHWHLYGNTLYFYDVWSNIHYGYVGRAAGFSEAVLLDGAGLEQIGSDLFRGRWPEKSPDTSGLRAWDKPEDRAAIRIGIELYRRHPLWVSERDVLAEVLNSPSITKKPYRP